MPSALLENLVKTGTLKTEPPNQQEFDGLLQSAVHKLSDARLPGLSDEGRFTLAYGAAHALAVAALRWHGYRAEARYVVFQCLQETIGLERSQWMILDKCHRQRNLAEYEGYLEMTPQLMDALIEVTIEVHQRVLALGAVQ
ncbi:MAG: hypothetical protein EP312_05995 [Gammaproteobacteria bacterium]|nr:MAG: hypothetical protein EP312_05995 [Gammaproteobacteria bacterium]